MPAVKGTKQVLKAVAALEGARDPHARLAATRALVDLVDQLERRVVADARDRGMTWREIGERYGMSKQAAQQRFGPGPAPARQRR